MKMKRNKNSKKTYDIKSCAFILSIPTKYSMLQIMGYLKGKSSMMILERHSNLKYKFGNKH